jgi:hypothetical protein
MTGGMWRTHLRGHTNILKRLHIHISGFNLGLVMRHLIGLGTPRGLRGRVAAVIAALLVLLAYACARVSAICATDLVLIARRRWLGYLANLAVNSSTNVAYTTGSWQPVVNVGPAVTPYG